jgi:metal-sulfur cluster biosynthetic enzyme
MSQEGHKAFSVVSLTVVGCDASHIIAQSAANQRSHIRTHRRVSITTINELQATDREIVGHRWLQKASSGLLQE